MRPSHEPVIVASNRGPVSYVPDASGRLRARRGVGGLVTALSSVLEASGGLWIAAAMTEGDRARSGRDLLVGSDPARYKLRLLAFDPPTYRGFYDGISNRLLWFVHHRLWDLPRTPTFQGARADWAAYRAVNSAYAEALDAAAPAGARPAFLIQDYHLSLAPAMLRRRRPDARIAWFSHIPFAGPEGFSILPAPMRESLLEGMLGADVVGFQAPWWAANFLLCCRLLRGATVDVRRRIVRWDGREVRVGVYPISIDLDGLRSQASSTAVRAARQAIMRWKGEARLMLRVDRAELSKNVPRGLLAYEAFLRAHREWRGRVVFLALLNPSRQQIPEYRRYTRECVELARVVNERLARGSPRGWQPVRMSLRDDHPRALAAYQLYDVLVVNPVFDGMNLVAKEGPVLNERDGVLILSENAGAFAELGRHVVPVNPFDVDATAEAIERALEMDPAERRRRADGLRAAVSANPIDRWVRTQLQDLARL